MLELALSDRALSCIDKFIIYTLSCIDKFIIYTFIV